MFHLFFKNISQKKEDIKFYPAPLDALCQELFIHILKFVVALLVSRQVNFVCACTGRSIKLYNPREKKSSPFQYPWCANQKTKKPKKVPFLPISAPISTKWLGHRCFQDELHFCRLILQSRRRTEIVRKPF